MTANRQSGSIHHGMYIKISRLAEIIGASPVDIVAAAKVCGHQVVPGMIWFQKEVTTEFVEEVWLIQKMNASAAARKASNAPR